MSEKNIVEVKVGFDLDEEKIKYIESDFMKNEDNYKHPIEYTARLLEFALEKWIREQVGVFCPNCDIELEEGWKYCPNCGWSENE